MDKSCITPTDIICNALLQDVMNRKEDTPFTLKELIQGYCKSDAPTHMARNPTSVIYKWLYEQLLIRNLAYVGSMPDGAGLEDVVWYRQFSNGMYELYEECK